MEEGAGWRGDVTPVGSLITVDCMVKEQYASFNHEDIDPFLLLFLANDCLALGDACCYSLSYYDGISQLGGEGGGGHQHVTLHAACVGYLLLCRIRSHRMIVRGHRWLFIAHRL